MCQRESESVTLSEFIEADRAGHIRFQDERRYFKTDVVWRNVGMFILLHTAAIYGFYLGLFFAKWETLVFAWLLHLFSGMLGITAGAHRLWSHKTYKAALPLRVILMIAQTTALQNDIYEWCRDHRVHHKFSETDGDPHNSKRGFFFAHMGWLMMKKDKMVIEKGRKIDCADLLDDPVVAFQRRFYRPLAILFCFVLPGVLPVVLWNESILVSYFFPTFSRYVFTLHMTWLVNSAAHFFGDKPYDRFIKATENGLVTLCTGGEGWHNYHHAFPQDYRAAELGWWRFNLTTNFIDCMAWLGLVMDRKSVSLEMAWSRAKKLGDGTHEKELKWTLERLAEELPVNW
ncbi:delta(9)-fatty-acid desaturase fat-7-like isoform X1 [Artemia franciscana]|nr:stearoyl-CoA desaturase-like protein isoform 2 [Artemia franciscana]